MIDQPVRLELVHRPDEGGVLEEHGVHRVPHAQQDVLGQTLDRAGEIVLQPQVRAARGEPEIARADEHTAAVGEHLVEAAEDRIAGNADEEEPVPLVLERADAVRDLELELLHEIPEEGRALGGAAQRVDHAEIHRAVDHRVEHGRASTVELEHALPAHAHLVRVPHHLAQPVDVEAASGELLASRDQLAQLVLDVPAVTLEVLGRGAPDMRRRPRAGNIDRHDRRVVHPLPDLGPLEVRVARVRLHGDRRLGDAPHGMLPAAELDADVRLHVAADVRRVPVVLGRPQILVGHAPHRRLERVDLGEDHVDVEGAEDLRHAPHHEHVRGGLAALRARGEIREPRPREPRRLHRATPHDRARPRRRCRHCPSGCREPQSNSTLSTNVSSWIWS